MKQLYFLRITFPVILFLFATINTYAQPAGANLYNAINAGTLGAGSTFTDTKNNSTYNGYSNDIGQLSDDIYYRFTLGSSAEVSISHCGSAIDTYMHLLDGNGNILLSNDDNGPLCVGLQSSMKVQLAAGTYYVVSEGYYTTTGNITTSISIPSSLEVNEDFFQQMSQIFSSLETYRVPYGLLQDIAMEQTNLSNYNGTVLADSNYVNDGDFHAIYQTLVAARIHSNATAFTPINTIDSLSFLQRQPGKIVLSGLFYRYSRFKDNAVQNGQITVSGNKVYDRYVSGTWQNPYQTEAAFAMSPAASSYEGKNQQILLPASLWLSNVGSEVSSIQVNAGDGQGYRTVTQGQPVMVNYPDTGLKVLTYKLNLTNSTTLYSHSQIHIKASVAEIYPGSSTISVTATEAYNGSNAQGYMTIKYVNQAQGLRNPLIVAEGFDAGHILNPDLQNGNNNLRSFLLNVDNSPHLNNLLINGSSQYDIVYVDWKNGTDYIQRNALLLKEVIRKVNQLKAQAGSTAKNVVLGQSMGGLVARWALKDMEANNEDHQTRLYISYDSPHQGANVPLGYQHLARHARKLYVRAGIGTSLVEVFTGKDYKSMLDLADQPAAKQMLINFVNKDNQINNLVHDQWQAELKNKGYPQGFAGKPLRVVAVSNGSECAAQQEILPDGLLLSYAGKANTRFLTDLIGVLAYPTVSRLATVATGQPAFLLGSLPGKNEIKFDIKINATGNGGGNRVYYNKITYTKKILWLIPVTVNITNKSYNAPSGALTYDSYPGGFYDTGFEPSNASSTNYWTKYNISVSHQQRFNFIPTTSALDIGSGNVTLTDADYKTKYIGSAPPVSPKNTPFQNFTTGWADSRINEYHTSINARNGEWVAGELSNNNPQSPDCTFLCSGISGPASFCSSQTYSINNFPPGSLVTWNAIGAIAISGSNTQNPVTVVAAGSGAGTLTATITSPCGNASFTKTIQTGVPVITPIEYTYNGNSYPIQEYFSVPNNPVCGTFTTATFSIAGATYYSTQVLYSSDPYNTWGESSGPNNLQLYVEFPDYNQVIIFRITATSACGTDTFDVAFRSEDCYGGYQYAVSPNPANNEITVEATDVGEQTHLKKVNNKKVKEFSVQIYNDKGAVLKEAKNNGQLKVSMNTADLSNGTYFLHITEGKKVIKKQIIIQH